MKSMISKLLNMLYPRCCPLCHKILKDQSRLICPVCEQTLLPVCAPYCLKCGKPVEREQEYCRDCASHPRVFEEGRGIFLYDEKMKLSLMKYKYYGCREYGRFYAKAICVFGKRELLRWKPDLIVPVPMYPKKQRMRGFNQSEYLAQCLGEYTGIPVHSALVRKIKNTKSQKKLNAQQRQRNLKEAFRVEADVEGLCILVIDDVYTTGSTVNAMAACLRERGAEKIFFFTVCIGHR